MSQTRIRIAALLLAATASSAFALQLGSRPTIGGITAEPAGTKAGESVTFTVTASAEGSASCGLVVSFGDGAEEQIKVKEGFPVKVAHAYAKPGNYDVKAFGREITTHNMCKGEALTKVAIAAVAGGAAAAPAAAVAAPACPAGYGLVKGSAKKNGAFTCAADAPATPLACAAGRKYFASKGQIGCR